ncbi:General stress protein 26 [Spirosomataceae bacterium TFI 002]|nr:General stress protein 26 [Spirosomataceae bacterium TFI 002]
MKPLPLIYLFLSISLFSFGQSDEEKLKSIAREIIAESTHCNLITVDDEGRPRVRVMDAFAPENDFTVWLATNPRSRKVEQIKNNPNATLYYLTPDRMSYVMIQGEAEIVNDLDKKNQYWKEGWESFYPDKSKDMILIKVSPRWMEIVSYPNGVLGDTETWKPAILEF